MSRDIDKKPIFRDLAADDPDPETTEIESLCMNCGENGITRLLLTKIPFYKDVVLMSFDCEKCGFQNNEIQSGGKVAETGVKIVLKISTQRDLNRQVVKSDYTSVEIPEVEFEIPAQSQKGEITTVEGIIDRSITGLKQDQPQRREENPEAAEKIEQFISKLKDLKEMKMPFSMIFVDISGNMFIENPNAPHRDTGVTVTYFNRTKEQDHSLGIYEHTEIEESGGDEPGILKPLGEGEHTLEDLQGEVLQFPTNCPNCNCPCQTNMKLTKIPHFKEVIIMATNCESCGHRTNEVKSGSAIEPKGVRIEVTVSSPKDLTRDLLKSETCSLILPELDVEVGPAALGGRFTTVEGILVAMKEQLAERGAMFGDSVTPETSEKLSAFLARLDCVLNCKESATLVLDDPAGNSYIQNLTDDCGEDHGLKITYYERSFEQNEELGLNDMKTENYEQD
ncbi:zinc finger protein ZPR1 [Schistocerca cancellata]|uniref:zinc finger protein ZPR1 n=1 Tax=Schistocerca cancellata TaxID=274614 RepID=UPI0021183E68|nr:zinc finger protein ZPR1 [Schistocerca cancellata]